MKHYFLINPNAGGGIDRAEFENKVMAAAEGTGEFAKVIETSTSLECEKLVKTLSLENPDEECVFYACGGDGTLCSVVNGAAGVPNAIVSVVPVGTGNDFVRNFTQKENFLDPEALIKGHNMDIDLIKYNDRCFINMLNTGFDCEVVKEVVKLKKTLGKLSYIGGVFTTLVRKPGVMMKISVDGGEYEEKDLLLTCISNGSFCGGGFHSAPYADIRDGIIDIAFVKQVSRIKFISLLGDYKSGKYLERKNVSTFAEYRKCRNIDIKFPKTQSVSIDGEIEDYDSISLSVLEKAARLRVPDGSEYMRPVQKEAETV